MAEYNSLNDAMEAEDDLAEAKIRYRMLAEAFKELPQLRSQLNPQLERAKAEISRLRALAKPSDATEKVDPAKVIPFDADRFRKSS